MCMCSNIAQVTFLGISSARYCKRMNISVTLLYEYRRTDTAKIGIHVTDEVLLNASKYKHIHKNCLAYQEHYPHRILPTVLHNSRKCNGEGTPAVYEDTRQGIIVLYYCWQEHQGIRYEIYLAQIFCWYHTHSTGFILISVLSNYRNANCPSRLMNSRQESSAQN
jgi:hypothetical protein